MTVRIGFLGTGFMGQLAHLDNYHRVSDCKVVAVAEIRPELGRQVAARLAVVTDGKNIPRFTSRKAESKSTQPHQ